MKNKSDIIFYIVVAICMIFLSIYNIIEGNYVLSSISSFIAGMALTCFAIGVSNKNK